MSLDHDARPRTDITDLLREDSNTTDSVYRSHIGRGAKSNQRRRENRCARKRVMPSNKLDECSMQQDLRHMKPTTTKLDNDLNIFACDISITVSPQPSWAELLETRSLMRSYLGSIRPKFESPRHHARCHTYLARAMREVKNIRCASKVTLTRAHSKMQEGWAPPTRNTLTHKTFTQTRAK